MSRSYLIPHPDGGGGMCIAVPTDGADGWGRHGEYKQFIVAQHQYIERLRNDIKDLERARKEDRKAVRSLTDQRYDPTTGDEHGMQGLVDHISEEVEQLRARVKELEANNA